MPKNLASVKPVKCYGWAYNGKISVEEVRDRQNPLHETPCTLLTTARYKKLMDVVKAAVAEKNAGDAVDASPTQPEWDEHDRCVAELRAAIEAAEKAGAL
ncbi:MAG: hypothetical protein WC100_05940 [Sterolibacterium sp.]